MKFLKFGNKILKGFDQYLADGPVYNSDNRFFISGYWGSKMDAGPGEIKTPIITQVSGVPWSAVASTEKQRYFEGLYNSGSQQWKYTSGWYPQSGYMFKPNVKMKDTTFSAYIKTYGYYYSWGNVINIYSASDASYPVISQNSTAAGIPSGNFPTVIDPPFAFSARYDLKSVEFPSATNCPNMPYAITVSSLCADPRPTIGAESCWTLTGRLTSL